jgi:hypothetical protein
MPKITKYPRLRTKVYKGAGGQAYVYYTYDMRPDGEPDIRLGKDYAEAIAKWDEIHNKKPRIVGRLQEAFDKWRDKVLPTYVSAETRKGYAKNLRKLEPVFGQMVWDEVTVPILVKYLELRSAKTQGNRELSVLSIIWGKARLWGMTQVPWPAAGMKDWKNPENEREFAVTDELFNAVYAEGDQVLRDCMDIASATGLRLTDARTVRMPIDGKIRHKANKSKKWAEFTVADSPVLQALVERREAMKAHSVMLLATNTGRQVSYSMLRDRWDEARERAAQKAQKTGNPDFAATIRAMFLRDMRSRAADLAADIKEASKLLQHSSEALTRKHYRTKAEKLKAVR